MANYAPPTEDVPIFNGNYFTDIPLTSKTGDGRYLKLIAQGDEDMNGYDINNINQVDTNSVKFSDNTIQTTAFTGSVGIPPGSIIAFAGSVALPSGYLLCDGTPYNNVDYPDLFTALGYTYGNPSFGKFQVPQMVNAFIMGGSVSNGTQGGSNAGFITDANITPFQPTQAPVQTNNISVAFNSSSGIPDWRYIKGEPTGDGSQNKWFPYTTSDNANGTALVSALEVGTGTTSFDKRPGHYVMVYMIKT